MEAHLTVESGPVTGTVFVVREGDRAVVGGGAGVQHVLPGAAPRHVGLILSDGQLAVHAMAAGVSLNDQPLAARQPAMAQAGDLLVLGPHALRVDLVGGRRAARPQPQVAQGLQVPAIPPEEYELLSELGRGATGRVYAARRRADGRLVAIKVLAERITSGHELAEAQARFEREGAAVARLQSPFVVQLLDRRVHDGRTILVMELIDGPSVRDLLQRGPLTVPQALSVGEDVARALAAAAQVGVVHRDVKPANILVGPDGRAKLCDFGMAKDLEAQTTVLTRTGQGLGTLAYLPPEQVDMAKHVDARADTYSLGATLYHLLAGRPPFQATSVADLDAIVDQPPPPLTSARPDCPPEVAAFVESLLAKKPEDRPAPWSVPRAIAALRAQYG